MSVTPNLRLWSVTSNASSIICGFAKADTEKKEVLTFYKFEQTVASAIAKEYIERWFEEEIPTIYSEEVKPEEIKNSLQEGIKKINNKVNKWRQKNKESLGSTLAIIIFCEGEYIAANLGDSRIYKFNEEQHIQITKDQTLAQVEIDKGNLTKEEAAKDSRQHTLTQCLGMEEEPKPDFFKGKYKEGDYFIICSDGMYNTIDIETMKKVVCQKKKTTKEKLIEIVEKVKENGEKDNATGIAVQV